MPAPGDQYAAPHIKNPFDERAVSAFTAAEIATLQSRLNKQLGPEYISHRSGAGGSKVAYLEGTKAIALANDVFGFNGWSSSLQQVQIDYVDENPSSGRVNLGLSIVVRVTLKDGTYHEDIGYGMIENCKGKGAAFEKAKKEAATDGLKRALRSFGNVLGNCLYDKEYLKKIATMKVKPTNFDEAKLHRHPDYRPREPAKEESHVVKKEENAAALKPKAVSRTETPRIPTGESMDLDDEFGGNDFDGVEFSEHGGDEFTLESLSVPDEEFKRPPEPSKSIAQKVGPPPRPGVRSNNGPAQQLTGRTQSMPSGHLSNGNNQCPPPQQRNQGPPRSGPQNPQTPVRPEAQRPRGPAATVDIHAAGRPVAQQPQQRPPVRPVPPPPQPHSNGTNLPLQHPPQQQNQQPAPPRPPPQQQHPPSGPSGPPAVQAGFVTSRAAELLRNADPAAPLPSNVPAFNPHAESPQLDAKRTPGIDRSRSMKIKREQVGQPPANPPGQQPQPQQAGNGVGVGGGQPFRPLTTAATNNHRPPANFVNPNMDPNRRIGLPGGGHAMMSPLANRGAYKPPTIHGQAAGGAGIKRPPLADVSNNTANGANGGNGAVVEGGGGMEPNKRPKLDASVGVGGKGPDRENVAPGDVA